MTEAIGWSYVTNFKYAEQKPELRIQKGETSFEYVKSEVYKVAYSLRSVSELAQ